MEKLGYLTATEYRAIRWLLGITQAEAQKFHGLQNIRTIKRWESGISRISEIACSKITGLLEKVNFAINHDLENFEALPDEIKKDNEIILIIYPDSSYKKYAFWFIDLPNSAYNAMIYRLYAALKERGAKVGIVEFNSQDYFNFLAAKGLKDDQSSRSMWALDYYDRLNM